MIMTVKSHFEASATGCYSGIDNRNGDLRRFQCVDATRILTEVLKTHGRIDVLLKVDVEAAEALSLPKLPPEVLQGVGVVCVEGKEVLNSPGFHLSRSISGVLRYTYLPDG